MLVERNCAGTYLNIAGGSYLVCNEEMLADYTNGDFVKATVKKVDCEAKPPLCYLNYHYLGTVKILKVK